MSYFDPNTQQQAPVEPGAAAQADVNTATLDGDWTKQDRPEPGTLYYCPACGARYEYRRQCFGAPAAGHPGTEVVDAVEIWDARFPEDARDPVTGRQYPEGALDPSRLTAAPAGE